MPELPDVEMQKRYFDSTAPGRRISGIDLLENRILKGFDPSRLDQALRGRRFHAGCRHGKYLFAGLVSGPWVVFHFGMDGYLIYSPERENPEGNARLLIHFDNGYRLSYNSWRMLGKIAVTETPSNYLKELGIGPDALDPRLDFRRFREALAGKQSPVKTVLMDQHVLAGIGNIYADEILFQARIHPLTGVDALDERRLKELYRAVRKVLRGAIRYDAEIGRFPAGYLLPHRRPNGRCPACGRPLETIRSGGRTGYYCPHDQPG